jgi:hypothetical protein
MNTERDNHRPHGGTSDLAPELESFSEDVMNDQDNRMMSKLQAFSLDDVFAEIGLDIDHEQPWVKETAIDALWQLIWHVQFMATEQRNFAVMQILAGAAAQRRARLPGEMALLNADDPAADRDTREQRNQAVLRASDATERDLEKACLAVDLAADALWIRVRLEREAGLIGWPPELVQQLATARMRPEMRVLTEIAWRVSMSISDEQPLEQDMQKAA